MQLSLTLPIYWAQSKSKTVLLSMNWLRTAHYHTQAKFKREYHELILNQLPTIDVPFEYYSMTYNLYYRNAQCDPSNVVPLIEKTVLDAFQAGGIVSNDNVRHHLSTSYQVVGQDKLNPRCEITINQLKEP